MKVERRVKMKSILGHINPAQLKRARAEQALVHPRELLFLALLGIVYWVVSLLGVSDSDLATINILGPSALIVILVVGAWWQVRRSARSIWQPLFWFRVSCAAYYGFGALAPYLANFVTDLRIRSLYDFTESDVFKVGSISLLGVFSVLFAAALIDRNRRGGRVSPRANGTARSIDVFLFALIFLAGGGAVRYLLVLPWTLGLVNDVPGVVIPLARAYNIGLYLLVLSAMRGGKWALLLSIALVPLDLFVGLLTFAKNHVLLTLVFVSMGFLHEKISAARSAWVFALVFGVYSQLDPIVHFGRDSLQQLNGANIGSLGQRLSILKGYTGRERLGTHNEGLQSWLLRLSYVNAGAMVVNWYDAGSHGNTLAHTFVVLVPRAIWPDKPVITSTGSELYFAATGNEGSSISPGLFAEAYWNFGWLGIPLLMMPFGGLLAVFSRYSNWVMLNERLLHLPGVMLGVILGYRVDGWYVSDVVGGGGLSLAYVLIAFSLERQARAGSRFR